MILWPLFGATNQLLAGLAFLVADGVTSIPAAIAIFALYVSFALIGSGASGFLYQLWLA